MAIMIPSEPHNCTEESREREIFEDLKKGLSDDYFVFHSYKLSDIYDEYDIANKWHEYEIDFMIYHREKGLICIEAKAGKVYCESGHWYYGNGDNMHDPFDQVNRNKWAFSKQIEKLFKNKDVLRHFVMLEAVCFPSITRADLHKVGLPAAIDQRLILTYDDLKNPQLAVDEIYKINTTYSEFDIRTKKHISYEVRNDLHPKQEERIFRDILFPTFDILPSKTIELDRLHNKFNVMLEEQKNLLKYLKYQPTAAINGAAGTGKTMIAVEKARLNSADAKTTLFLCFNSKLREHLASDYPYPGVDYFTVDGYACTLISAGTADYELLELELQDMKENNTFPYDHVIIDEAQDLGQLKMSNMDAILALLQEMVLKKGGSFYVFYDKRQIVQGIKVPEFILNSDCRLTLYKNCRNTRRIAETSFRAIGGEPMLFDSAIEGNQPRIVITDAGKAKAALDAAIAESLANEMSEIQIVSCTGEGNSIFKNLVHGELYDYKKNPIKFTTARKFKGLEADHVILVDVDWESVCGNGNLFYVGSSRAKLELTVIAALDDEECIKIIDGIGGSVKKKFGPRKSLAIALSCKLQEAEKQD